jgi:hypothetical protein
VKATPEKLAALSKRYRKDRLDEMERLLAAGHTRRVVLEVGDPTCAPSGGRDAGDALQAREEADPGHCRGRVIASAALVLFGVTSAGRYGPTTRESLHVT